MLFKNNENFTEDSDSEINSKLTVKTLYVDLISEHTANFNLLRNNKSQFIQPWENEANKYCLCISSPVIKFDRDGGDSGSFNNDNIMTHVNEKGYMGVRVSGIDSRLDLNEIGNVRPHVFMTTKQRLNWDGRTLTHQPTFKAHIAVFEFLNNKNKIDSGYFSVDPGEQGQRRSAVHTSLEGLLNKPIDENVTVTNITGPHSSPINRNLNNNSILYLKNVASNLETNFNFTSNHCIVIFENCNIKKVKITVNPFSLY